MTGSNNVVTLDGYDSNNVGISAGASDGEMFHIGGFLLKTPPYGYNGIGVVVYDDSVTLDNITADGFGTGFWDADPTEMNTVQNCIASNYYYSGFHRVDAGYCIADGSGPYDYLDGSTDATDLTEDPLYCDRASNEYDLRVDSYGNPENNGSGETIGAYGVGCMYGTLARDSDYEGGGTLSFPADLTVPSGKSLTLGAGTTVEVSATDSLSGGNNTSKVELNVSGSLTLSGSSGTPSYLHPMQRHRLNPIGRASRR